MIYTNISVRESAPIRLGELPERRCRASGYLPRTIQEISGHGDLGTLQRYEGSYTRAEAKGCFSDWVLKYVILYT
ncbi:hypothetical protein VB732_33385 [Nostoc sp. UHCC 0252]|nr:hypothetical protein [Nostoc sp. UHCC 0252]MEA5605991.1 hypothetical protein [Nostoc sp. UHCC 0252]